MLFSVRHAVPQASQPVHRSSSTDIPHTCVTCAPSLPDIRLTILKTEPVAHRHSEFLRPSRASPPKPVFLFLALSPAQECGLDSLHGRSRIVCNSRVPGPQA